MNNKPFFSALSTWLSVLVTTPLVVAKLLWVKVSEILCTNGGSSKSNLIRCTMHTFNKFLLYYEYSVVLCTVPSTERNKILVTLSSIVAISTT